MAQPPDYEPGYDFSDFQAVNPDRPLPADRVDIELAQIGVVVNWINANLELIQRDDGELANATVGRDQLKAGLQVGMNQVTTWAAAVSYSTDDAVMYGSQLYVCAAAHTSTDFLTDLAAERWSLVADLGVVTVINFAENIVYDPGASGLSAVKVQSAIDELASEKAEKTTTISAGTGLTGGGDLSANRTLTLADTAVTPGAYTAADITVDAQGRITAASNGEPGAGTTADQIVYDPETSELDAEDVQAALDEIVDEKADKAITISAGAGLSGGGSLAANRTISHATSAVTPGAYTAANITVDARGHITAATNGSTGGSVTSIATGAGLTGGPITTSGTVAHAASAVTPGSYTNASLTVDARGHVTAASNGTAPSDPYDDSAPHTIGGAGSPDFTVTYGANDFDNGVHWVQAGQGGVPDVLTGDGFNALYHVQWGTNAAPEAINFAGHADYNQAPDFRGAKAHALQVMHYVGGGSSGRESFASRTILKAPQTDDTDRHYAAVVGQAIAASGDGGTSAPSYKGQLFGGNFVVSVNAGGVPGYFLNLTGAEFNVLAADSSTVASYVSGVQIANGQGFRGATYDCALAISGYGSHVGNKHGILIGDMNGVHPVYSGGTLIGTTGSATVLDGIDFSSYTINGAALKANGLQITTGANASLELGIKTSPGGTPFIDFNSSGTTNDRDVRVIASGGTSGTNDRGALQVQGQMSVAWGANTNFALQGYRTDASHVGTVARLKSARSATASYAFLTCVANDDDNDVRAKIVGDGSIANDTGTYTSPADYAEFYESVSGEPIDPGVSVVLAAGKVRPATAQDAPASIIGVVRPRLASTVVGNAAPLAWQQKFLRDAFGGLIYESFTVTRWVDSGIAHAYATDRIPSNLIVPVGAEVVSTDADGNPFRRAKVNPDYDPDEVYVPRIDRPEWIVVGLMGQIPVKDGQPVGDRWLRMSAPVDGVAMWHVR